MLASSSVVLAKEWCKVTGTRGGNQMDGADMLLKDGEDSNDLFPAL